MGQECNRGIIEDCWVLKTCFKNMPRGGERVGEGARGRNDPNNVHTCE
jgi:hypothetical protein